MHEPPASVPPPSHVDLLAMSQAMRRAVLDDDTEQIHVLLCRLRTDLVNHLRVERGRPSAASDAVRVVIHDGHQRLLEQLDDAMLDMERDDTGCNCLVRSVQIEVALRRQAMLEATVAGHRPLATSTSATTRSSGRA